MSWGDNGHARPTTEAYRNNKFWEKKNETLEAENEPVKQGNDNLLSDDGKVRDLGRDGGGSGTDNSGDDV